MASNLPSSTVATAGRARPKGRIPRRPAPALTGLHRSDVPDPFAVEERDDAVLADLQHRTEAAGGHRGGRARPLDRPSPNSHRPPARMPQDGARREQPAGRDRPRWRRRAMPAPRTRSSRGRWPCVPRADAGDRAGTAPAAGCCRRCRDVEPVGRAPPSMTAARGSRTTTNSAPSRASARSSAVWNRRGASAVFADRLAPTAGTWPARSSRCQARAAEREQLRAFGEHLDFARRAEHGAHVAVLQRRARVRLVGLRARCHLQMPGVADLAAPPLDVDDVEQLAVGVRQKHGAHAVSQPVEALDGRQRLGEYAGAGRHRRPAGRHGSSLVPSSSTPVEIGRFS